jgi:hypothetical protein
LPGAGSVEIALTVEVATIESPPGAVATIAIAGAELATPRLASAQVATGPATAHAQPRHPGLPLGAVYGNEGRRARGATRDRNRASTSQR